MRKRIKQIMSILLISTLLTACSEETATQPKPAQPTNETPAGGQTHTEPNANAYTSPLTGLASNVPVDKRPVMVMMNNHPKARPQSGLNQADIVYEVLAEGEVTRFLAIFQSQKPEVIGPVRSIRPYFIDIGRGFDAVLVHAGGSPDALETLAQNDFSNINEISNGAYFWREKFRRAPHNLYTDLDRIEQAIQDKGMRPSATVPNLLFLPAETTITSGEPAAKIDVTFHPAYKISYAYDQAKGKYLRFTQGTAHTDLQTKEQLSVTNLLVIASAHRVLDREGRRAVDVVGPGDGYLFQQGKARKVKWRRKDGVIRAYEDAAFTKEIPLLAGNTWINIVPNVPGLDQSVKFQ